jgi:hypothetical protein
MDEEAKAAQRAHKKRQRSRRKEEYEERLRQIVLRPSTTEFLALFKELALPFSDEEFSFDGMPAEFLPEFTLNGARGKNKRLQCLSFARALKSVIGNRSDLVLIDFGSGKVFEGVVIFSLVIFSRFLFSCRHGKRFAAALLVV